MRNGALGATKNHPIESARVIKMCHILAWAHKHTTTCTPRVYHMSHMLFGCVFMFKQLHLYAIDEMKCCEVHQISDLFVSA